MSGHSVAALLSVRQILDCPMALTAALQSAASAFVDSLPIHFLLARDFLSVAQTQ